MYQIHALWARYMHCWAVCYDNTWTTGYKSIITPHCRDMGWYTHTPPYSALLRPQPSGVYNSQIPQRGVITNTLTIHYFSLTCNCTWVLNTKACVNALILIMHVCMHSPKSTLVYVCTYILCALWVEVVTCVCTV